jgi:hypothetical protein
VNDAATTAARCGRRALDRLAIAGTALMASTFDSTSTLAEITQ